MGTAVTILAILAAAVFVAAAFLLFAPQRRDSMNIHLDPDTKVNISKGEDGDVHLRFATAGGGGDEGLWPAVNVDMGIPGDSLDRPFWDKVSRIETLGEEERAVLCAVLFRHRLITREEMDALVNPGEASPEDGISGGAAEAPSDEDLPAVLSPEDIWDPWDPDLGEIGEDEF